MRVFMFTMDIRARCVLLSLYTVFDCDKMNICYLAYSDMRVKAELMFDSLLSLSFCWYRFILLFEYIEINDRQNSQLTVWMRSVILFLCFRYVL